MDSSVLDAVTQAFGVLFKGRNLVRLLGGLGVTVQIAAVSVIFFTVFRISFWNGDDS